MARGVEERARLLEEVRHQLVAHGLTDVSLSGMARQVGSNNRMLLYYFGSLEALLDEAIEEIMQSSVMTSRLAELLSTDETLESRLVAAWQFIADPEREPRLRIFFTRFGKAADRPAGDDEFLRLTKDDWVDVVTSALRDDGHRVRTRDKAVTVVAMWRGLQVALLSGEPRKTVDRAHRESVRALLRSWSVK